MPSRDWRSEADYAFVDGLDISGLAWEFLRRNPQYHSEYLAARGGDSSHDLPVTGGGLSPRWGLRFRRRS